jgi:hypothetical protein
MHASAKELAYLHSLFRATATDFREAYKVALVKNATPTKAQCDWMTDYALKKLARLKPPIPSPLP